MGLFPLIITYHIVNLVLPDYASTLLIGYMTYVYYK